MEDPFTSLLAARAGRITGPDPAELVATWERAESTLNARMRVVLGFLGTEMPQVFSELIAGAGVQLPSLRVTAGRNPIGGKRNDKLFGQPDIVLLGETVAVTVEMKVRGGEALAKYDAEQHFKYLRLAEAMEQKFGVGRVHHVLLAPFAGGRVVKNADLWLAGPAEHGTPLALNLAGFRASISLKQHDQAFAEGSEEWIARLEARMPSRAVDLAQFLDEVDRVEWADESVKFECGRQVAALRAYGLRQRSTGVVRGRLGP
jgi:hypothetical protein